MNAGSSGGVSFAHFSNTIPFSHFHKEMSERAFVQGLLEVVLFLTYFYILSKREEEPHTKLIEPKRFGSEDRNLHVP
jgi:hypothetical protein